MVWLILVLLLVLPQSAWSTTYYVATTGSDSANGTSESTPWLTINKAVTTMVAGDTTYVKSGTYNEGEIRFRRSGTGAQPIKLLAYPGATPKVHFVNGIIENGFDHFLVQHANGYWLPVGWITIEGFEIENGREGIKIYNCHDCTFRRNWIHDNGHGLLGNGTRVVLDRNVINHNGQFDRCAQGLVSCNGDHGVYANGTAFRITNNLIYDNMAYGIQLNATVSYDPTRHAGSEFAESHNWVIAHNTIAYNRYRSAIVIWRSLSNNTTIENNIFYENGVTEGSSSANGVNFLSATPTGVVIRNNLSYASGSGATIFITPGSAVEGVNYTQSNNLVNSTYDPAFVNGGANSLPASPDWTLTSSSAALNIGYAGYPCNGSACDAGAFETVGTPTAAITANKLAVTFPMNLNTPVQLASTTGWSISCTANPTACPGSPTISAVALKSGSSSVLEVTIAGIASDTCSTGQDWKITYDGTGTVTDSANIGHPGAYKVQKIFSFTNLLATNACSGGPPAPPASPYIWYKFDGNADDSSGNALHGTATGTSYVAGYVSQGIKIDIGENDYVSVPYGNTLNMDTQSLTIVGGIYVDPTVTALNRVYFGASSLGISQRLYISTNNSTWMLGIQGSSDATGTSEFAVQPGWNRVCLRMDSGANRATLAVNGVTGAGTGVVKDFTAYSLAANFKIGSTLGTNTGAGQINDEWKIYTTLESCADDYAAWNTAGAPLTGTLDITASRWYGAKTQGGSRVALAANNTAITIGQTSAVAYVGQTNCTVTNCSQISQRLYYTCTACPSAGSELPVPDTPTADGISFYGVTSETGVLSGDHGAALTGSPTRIDGGTQIQSDSIPSFGLATGEAIVNTYVLQFTNATIGNVYKVYPKEQTGTALNSVTPTGGLTVTIASNSSGF